MNPLKVVGWEGLWGTIAFTIILIIMQFIPCTDAQLCPIGDRLDDVPNAFRQFAANPVILLFALFCILSIAFFNSFGVAVTKYANAAQRSTIDTSRTVLIWIFFLVYPGKEQEKFSWL